MTCLSNTLIHTEFWYYVPLTTNIREDVNYADQQQSLDIHITSVLTERIHLNSCAYSIKIVCVATNYTLFATPNLSCRNEIKYYCIIFIRNIKNV